MFMKHPAGKQNTRPETDLINKQKEWIRFASCYYSLDMSKNIKYYKVHMVYIQKIPSCFFRCSMYQILFYKGTWFQWFAIMQKFLLYGIKIIFEEERRGIWITMWYQTITVIKHHFII